jgi:hypothetical protein
MWVVAFMLIVTIPLIVWGFVLTYQEHQYKKHVH